VLIKYVTYKISGQKASKELICVQKENKNKRRLTKSKILTKTSQRKKHAKMRVPERK
jgi:hypothetical protein